MMHIYTLIAEAFCYPYPGLISQLEHGYEKAEESPAQEIFARFITQVKSLSLAEWEELSTRTLDLSPAAAPYVGFQIWGENYKRGNFMSKLNLAMYTLGVDTEGELPDHIVPILRYLAAADDPLPELTENLEPAVQRMIDILKRKEKDNPYLNLFEAVLAAAQSQAVTT